LALLGADASTALSQTLREVLNKHDFPVASHPIQNLDARITSFAVLDNATNFVIAYYIDDGSGLLSPPLYVLRQTKNSREWKIAALRTVQAPFRDFHVDCFGSALAIHQTAGFFFIDTHLSPSAGCLVVLAENLTVTRALYGWYLAAFHSGLLVFHKSEVHFAPTHPMEIALYDLRRSTETSLYPPPADPIRVAYIEKIRTAKPSEDWCRQHNSHCDAEQFESELTGRVVISEETQSLAFVARFGPVGLISEEITKHSPEWIEDVVYVFRLGSGPIRHREFHLAEMKERFGTTSLEALLKPTVLEQLFSPP
jgi:hypothetical protein